MWPNPQCPAGLVTFIEELLNGKLHFLHWKLQSDQSRITEQAKFTYYPLSKVFEKQIKTVEYQGRKEKTLEEHGEHLVKDNNKKQFSTHSKKRNFLQEWKK